MADIQPTISFSEIPYSWYVPGAYVEVRANYTKNGLLTYPAQALLITQMLAAGTATPLAVNQITRRDQAPALFGRGSIAAQQVAAFLAANPYTPLFVMGVSDLAAGVQATFTLTATGTATSAATGTVKIGNDAVTFAVASGDLVAAQATAAAAAINANLDLPVTAAAVAGVVTLTFRHKGECGNALMISVSTTGTGTTWAVAAGTTGSGNPTITTAIAAIAGIWYTDIIVPWTDSVSLGLLETELSSRFNAMGKLDAHLYYGLIGSLGTVQSFSTSRNSKYASSLPANGSPTPPWVVAASLGGVCSFQCANDPSRQLRGLVLPGVQPPPQATRYMETERNLLLAAGMSTFNVLIDGTVVIERIVTNNKTSDLGIPDGSWRDITVPKTVSRVRFDWRNFTQLNWPRNKLADDDSIAAAYDPLVATPRRLKASWAGRTALYEQKGWITNTVANLANAVFVRNGADPNRVDARQPITVIGNLMVLAGALEFDSAS